jgi:alpha-galactosidase
MNPTRRELMIRAGLLGVVGNLAGQTTAAAAPVEVSPVPDLITAFTEAGSYPLRRDRQEWTAEDVRVSLRAEQAGETAVRVYAERSALLRLHLRWHVKTAGAPEAWRYLGDQWERSYGDLGWRSLDPERILPWYFLASDNHTSFGYGVKTGAAAFCFWQMDEAGVSLWMDVRNGGRGVLLKGRELEAATIVSERYADRSAFVAARLFCKRMCESPRLPAQPAYGGNNWYYAYGKGSAGDIRRDSEIQASLASNADNRPYMVIDDGWSPFATAGQWSRGNERFPDMAGLASDMKRIGVRPGIWIRPLLTRDQTPESWRIAKRQALDPTVPEVVAQIRRDFQTLHGWGYELIKHDYSTFDLLGRWGNQMGAELTDEGWSFRDRSHTNAEVVLRFYRDLREATPDAVLLACNTVGHLSAGIFELQRIGDDTSGRDFNRTRKMGVNTLAFRAAQHGSFFAVDADCVGLTRDIPWELNRQWLQLLAKSGTPLFVSAAPDAVGPEQRKALQEAFAYASRPHGLAEPVDWMDTTQPARWMAGDDNSGKPMQFDWFGAEGASPFGK